MEDELPDFSALAGDPVEESCFVDPEKREMAATVMNLLKWPEGCEVEDKLDRVLHFQSGFSIAARICRRTESEEQEGAESKSAKLFGSTKNFFKKVNKALGSKSEEKESVVLSLRTFDTVKVFVSALERGSVSDEMTQGFVFNDWLVLAKPDPSTGKLMVVGQARLCDLSVRDIGSGYFVFEDPSASEDADEENDDDDDDDDVMEDSSSPGMKLAENMIELTDRQERVRFVLDTGGVEHKELWISNLCSAIYEAVTKEDPKQTVEKGWKHLIYRGNLWSAAIEGNVYQMGRILRLVSEQRVSSSSNMVDLVDVDAADDEGITPLHLAAWYGKSLVLRQLLQIGVAVDALDNELLTPLHYGCTRLQSICCVSLIDSHADVELKDLRDETPLLLCCSAALRKVSFCGGDAKKLEQIEMAMAKIVESLASKGANLDAANLDGQTSLHQAAREGQFMIMDTLLRAGVNVDAAVPGKNLSRTTLASLCGMTPPPLPLISKLLSWGADPNARDESKDTPLHILLSSDENTKSVDDLGTLVHVLISYGARVDLEDRNGKTAEKVLSQLGVSFAQSVRSWATKEEPVAVKDLIRLGSSTIPRGVGPESPVWQDDDLVNQCSSCQVQFSLIIRRHHCRSCGKIFCGTCCGKTITLNIQTASGSGSSSIEPTRVKVCSGCFNRLNREITIKSKEVMESAAHVNSDRAALFGAGRATQTPQPSSSTKQSKEEATKGIVSSAQQILRQAQESLMERGEKISQLSDKSAALSNNAANFSSLARQLREQEEKKANWFGFF